MSTEVDRRALEAERDFLLRSLDDLEAERVDGAIDDDTYRVLHDDYTARAAAALRALRGEGSEPTVAPAPAPRRRLLVIALIALFAIVAGVALSFALGARRDSELASGNEAAVGTEDRRVVLQAAVDRDPNDVAARLALAGFLVQQQELPAALEQYDAAAKLDPTNAEASAQAGWIVFLTATSTEDAAQFSKLIDAAQARLNAATAADPDYPDAHFYLGVLQLRGIGNPGAAIPEFQRYLVLVPDGPLSDQVRELLAEATSATTTTTVP